jgi:hypothetical protein
MLTCHQISMSKEIQIQTYHFLLTCEASKLLISIQGMPCEYLSLHETLKQINHVHKSFLKIISKILQYHMKEFMFVKLNI